MNEIGVALLVSIASATIAALGARILVSWICAEPRRQMLRHGVPSLVFLLGAGIAYVPVRRATSAADRICIRCGSAAYILTVFGQSFEGGQPRDQALHAPPYASVFADAIGKHRHRWDPFEWELASWFAYTAVMSDKALARAYVARLQSAPEALQREALRSFAEYRRTGAHPADDAFLRWRDDWRLLYPDWP